MSNSRRPQSEDGPGGLETIRLLVSQGRYEWTEKVQLAIEDGRFEPEDLEQCIATGTVTKKSKDRLGNSVGGRVYTILGSDRAGCEFYTAGKIVKGSDGALYFFITARRSKRG